MDDAADNLLERNRGRDAAVGIDRRERLTVDEPPRHAVEHRHDDGFRTDQRLELGSERGQRGRLDRDDDDILLAQCPAIVGGVDVGDELLALLLEPQPLGPDQAERVAAGEHADPLAGDGEPGRDPPADRASTDNGDLRRWSRHGSRRKGGAA